MHKNDEQWNKRTYLSLLAHLKLWFATRAKLVDQVAKLGLPTEEALMWKNIDGLFKKPVAKAARQQQQSSTHVQVNDEFAKILDPNSSNCGASSSCCSAIKPGQGGLASLLSAMKKKTVILPQDDLDDPVLADMALDDRMVTAELSGFGI